MSLIDIKCPNCGASIQLDNSRESGFCSYCGSKVQIQEVISKIKIDRSGDIKNYLSIGIAATEVGNGQEACDYANKILEIDPQNPEAWELKMAGIGCMPGYHCHEMITTGNKALELNQSPEIENRIYTSFLSLCSIYLKDASNDLLQDLDFLKASYETHMMLDSSTASSKAAEDDFLMSTIYNDLCQIPTLRLAVPNEDINNDEEFAEMTVDIAKEWIACGLALNKRYNTYGLYLSDEGIKYWKDILEKIKQGLPDKYKTEDISPDKLNINKWQPKTNRSQQRVRRSNPPKDEGCYIATAVYGSYEAPEVMVLRQFRDNTLSKTHIGKWFIKTYYRLSPPVAEKLKEARYINQFVRFILNKWVNHLKKQQ